MPYNRLSTTKIAKAVGCHPNTVRFYEKIGFISPVARSPKGYRLFTEAHLDQMRLARMGMAGPWTGRKIRQAIVATIQAAAAQDYPGALQHGYSYLKVVQSEKAQAEAAADFLEGWARGNPPLDDAPPLQIREVARRLDLTTDILRNWERNGLVSVPRNPANHYRLYRAAEIGRLRVIRMLRQSGYSPMAILRMLTELDKSAGADPRNAPDLRQVLDTPRPDEDVYSASDRWLSALSEQEQRAHEIITLLESMVVKYEAASKER